MSMCFGWNGDVIKSVLTISSRVSKQSHFVILKPLNPPGVSWSSAPMSHSHCNFFLTQIGSQIYFGLLHMSFPNIFFSSLSISLLLCHPCMILLGRASPDSIKFHYGNGGLGNRGDQRGCLCLILLLLLQYSKKHTFLLVCCTLMDWVWWWWCVL